VRETATPRDRVLKRFDPAKCTLAPQIQHGFIHPQQSDQATFIYTRRSDRAKCTLALAANGQNARSRPESSTLALSANGQNARSRPESSWNPFFLFTLSGAIGQNARSRFAAIGQNARSRFAAIG
jgi:hypothetical protein